MEAVEEPPLQNAPTEAGKVNDEACEENAEVVVPVQSDVCYKPNGVADSGTEPVPTLDETQIHTEHLSNAVIEENNPEINEPESETVTVEEIVETPITAHEEVIKEVPIAEEIVLKSDINEEEHDLQTEGVEIDGIVETMPENVRFETEILIETNVDDQTTKYQIIYEDSPEDSDHTNNILNEIGHNIELSEVLRSSDITENVENNNCEVTQEVFNKEELLDILEGNDMEEPRKEVSDSFASDCKKLETQLALQQLSRLRQTRKTRTTPKKTEKKATKIDSPKEEPHLTPRKRSNKQKEDNSQTNSSTVTVTKVENARRKSSKQKDDMSQSSSEETTELREESGKKRGNKQKDDNLQSSSDGTDSKEGNTKKRVNKQNTLTNSESVEESKEQNIVYALVQDWDDEEPSEGDQAKKVNAESNQLQGESEELVTTQEAAVNESQTSNADPSVGEEHTPSLNKNNSETQPQRRLSRVIKKKVIFDPDNPDTFTKTKVTIKKENQSEKDQKEQPTPKKIKTEVTPRSKSKSPIQQKLQWKKPQPKNIKQNKRLTEIDRLLMDEGAVNMICQLTPEAPQGNKNMKSKAEFIKKIQSSNPEGKEMKFRERKKEIKSEEGDPRKVGSGKHRLSLNSSVKSPTVSEDFEAHSADDSIIYRRHSSSSYSSPCMSPRRMSDVEGINQNSAATPQQPTSYVHHSTPQGDGTTAPPSDVFMADSAVSPTAVINKNNLMSIKEKLNSKLSQALNKRKRESTKPEKPPKIKRVSRSAEKVQASSDYKYVKLTIDQRLAEISIQSIGAIFNVEIINELRTALDTVDSNSEISVTFLTSESGSLCSGLELNSILDAENGTNHAIELAESVRLLLSTLECHSKLVCTAVEDRCHGLALSLVALSDVTVASETASFELSACKGTPLQPGAAALMAHGLPQSLVNELVLLERCVSAAEAARGGLVSRTVWPARAHERASARAIARDIVAQLQDGGTATGSLWPDQVEEQARAIARDIASQPHQNIMLKKQLLRLKRGAPEIFLSALQAERDLFVNYWTSAEGKEMIRASVETTK